MSLSAVLLAGGKSSRMGRDKAALEFRGQPLWQHQLRTLLQLSPAQLMFAGPPPTGCEAEAIDDETPNAGPLGAVAAALNRCTSSHLLVLAVDLPNVTADFLRGLFDLCEGTRGAVAQSARGLEPLAAIYPRTCASLAKSSLGTGIFSMQNFVRAALAQEMLRVHNVSDPESAQLFVNLNTPSDYERARDREIDRDC